MVERAYLSGLSNCVAWKQNRDKKFREGYKYVYSMFNLLNNLYCEDVCLDDDRCWGQEFVFV